MFISRANRRGSTCFSFSCISRSGMSSFERYGSYSFISGGCKYSVMAHDNTVIPNPACIKQYAISWPGYLYYWKAKYGSLCTGMRWSFCPSKRMVSHAGHHHVAKFSGKCLCIHAIFTVKHNIWPCPEVELPRLQISKHVSQNVGVVTSSDGLLRNMFVNYMIPEFFHRLFGGYIQGGT